MSSVMFDLSQSECHEVGVPLLATEPEPVVELDHGVSAVEGDLVAALFSCQKSQGCQQQLPQLSSSHLEMQECGLSEWTVGSKLGRQTLWSYFVCCFCFGYDCGL